MTLARRMCSLVSSSSHVPLAGPCASDRYIYECLLFCVSYVAPWAFLAVMASVMRKTCEHGVLCDAPQRLPRLKWKAGVLVHATATDECRSPGSPAQRRELWYDWHASLLGLGTSTRTPSRTPSRSPSPKRSRGDVAGQTAATIRRRLRGKQPGPGSARCSIGHLSADLVATVTSFLPARDIYEYMQTCSSINADATLRTAIKCMGAHRDVVREYRCARSLWLGFGGSVQALAMAERLIPIFVQHVGKLWRCPGGWGAYCWTPGRQPSRKTVLKDYLAELKQTMHAEWDDEWNLLASSWEEDQGPGARCLEDEFQNELAAVHCADCDLDGGWFSDESSEYYQDDGDGFPEYGYVECDYDFSCDEDTYRDPYARDCCIEG